MLEVLAEGIGPEGPCRSSGDSLPACDASDRSRVQASRPVSGHGLKVDPSTQSMWNVDVAHMTCEIGFELGLWKWV